jgi:hypothetical protein
MGCVLKYKEDLRHLQEELAGKRLDLNQILKGSPELTA